MGSSEAMSSESMLLLLIGAGLFALGMLLMIGFSIWHWVVAFQEGLGPGLLSVLLPGYTFYHGVSRWREAKWPWVGQVAGLLVLAVGMFLMMWWVVDEASRGRY
jgi:hypothetical protein